MLKIFSEDIKSATASAWDKSIFPFKNALLVNSPGFAGSQPNENRFSNILLVIIVLPWQEISIVSSPV